MWKYNNLDELYHFGILGMKWGHRKSKLEYAKKRQHLEQKEIQTRNKMYDYLYKKHKPKKPYTKQDIYDYSMIDKDFKLLFDEHEKYAKQLDKINREEIYHSNTELYHHGILGMRWGHRKARYQKHKEPKKNWKYHKNQLSKAQNEFDKKADAILSKENNMYVAQKKLDVERHRIQNKYRDSIAYSNRRAKRIKRLKITGAIAATSAIAALSIKNRINKANHDTAIAKQEAERLDKMMKDADINVNNLVESIIGFKTKWEV